MKKRILSFLVAVCLLVPCMFLVACGNTVEGKYSLHSIKFGELTWTKADYEAKAEATDLTEAEQSLVMVWGFMGESEPTIELKKDGTVVMTATYDEEVETTNGTWTKDGDTITLTITEGEGEEAEEYTQTLKYVEGKLVMANEEMEGVEVTFSK